MQKKQRAKQRAPKVQRRRRPKPRPKPAPVTTAIVKHPTGERTLRPQEIQLLKSTVAKNCTDEEFALFMLVCKKKKLDPFTKQIYCIKWPRRHGPDEMVIITGIGGYRSMAARSHRRDFGGTGKPTWTFDDKTLGNNGRTPAGRRIPDTATVSAFRRSGAQGEATCCWEEFAPADLKADRSDFWNRMPKHMLAKCAEAHALRKVFPDLSDIYSEEEMSQRLQDLTPGGLEISTNGVAPSGKILDGGQAQAKQAQKQVLDEKLAHGHAEGSGRAKQAQATLDRVEEEDRRLAAAKNVTPGKPGGTKEPKPPKPRKPPEEGATLTSGTIHRVVQGMTAERHVPYVSVRLNNTWFNIWSKTLQKFFQSEEDLVATVAEVWVDNKQKNIVGLKRIGSLHFQADGRTPVQREPGDE